MSCLHGSAPWLHARACFGLEVIVSRVFLRGPFPCTDPKPGTRFTHGASPPSNIQMRKISVLFPFSTKNIRLHLHGDAELTVARLHPYHARLALDGRVFEIEGKLDRLSDCICALGLKEKSRSFLLRHMFTQPTSSVERSEPHCPKIEPRRSSFL
jgi:hypothetical protein